MVQSTASSSSMLAGGGLTESALIDKIRQSAVDGADFRSQHSGKQGRVDRGSRGSAEGEMSGDQFERLLVEEMVLLKDLLLCSLYQLSICFWTLLFLGVFPLFVLTDICCVSFRFAL